MIYLYGKKRCASSVKAIQWFKRYGLEICMKSTGQISLKEIITALASTDKGISELVKHASHLSDEEGYKIHLLQTMSLNEAIEFIKLNPNLLKSPIIIEKNKVLIGYNPEQIRMFLPKEYRRKFLYSGR